MQGISSGVEIVMDGDKYVTARFAPVEQRAWTIMLYIDGDNNLESEALTDFNNMEGGLFNSQFYGQDFFDWITHDKGTARKLIDFGPVKNPKGIRTIGEFPNLTQAMVNAGWAEDKIRKVMGANWVRVLKEVWGAITPNVA